MKNNVSDFPVITFEKKGWPWTETPDPLPDHMPDGSDWPKISIVTPSYNQAEFLEETIRSVLLQRYPNLEYFIMDGGSTDESIEIIRKYEPWLTYWESEKDNGQSDAINKGWKHSSGQLVAWINSDDVYTPGAFVEVATLWKQDSTYGFINGITERIDQAGKPNGLTFGSEFNIVESLISSRNPVAQQSTFINRSAILSLGGVDVDLQMSMDWELWLRIGAKYPTRYVPRVWSRFRGWENAKSSTMECLSGPEHVWIVKKLFADKNIGLAPKLRRKAMAGAFGRSASLYYRHSEIWKFRKSLALSILYYPPLKGGLAQKLIPKAVPGLQRTQAYISQGKSIIKRYLHKLVE